MVISRDWRRVYGCVGNARVVDEDEGRRHWCFIDGVGAVWPCMLENGAMIVLVLFGVLTGAVDAGARPLPLDALLPAAVSVLLALRHE